LDSAHLLEYCQQMGNLVPEDPVPEDPIPEDPAALEPAAPPPRLPQIPALRQTPGQLASRSAVHLRTAGSALVNWWRAVTIQGLCVAFLWLIGLLLLHVPLAPVWALVAGLMTLVPNFGGVIALLGPAFSILVSQPSMYRLCFLLGLYAVIVVIDQLMLQPMIMKRVTRVPIWASILAPIVLGIVIPFWGILLAPPLLAVVYAFRRPRPLARISRQDP
jgi:predicted PurR-regulated permease PerM